MLFTILMLLASFRYDYNREPIRQEPQTVQQEQSQPVSTKRVRGTIRIFPCDQGPC